MLNGECKEWPEVERGEKERFFILVMAFSQKYPPISPSGTRKRITTEISRKELDDEWYKQKI